MQVFAVSRRKSTAPAAAFYHPASCGTRFSGPNARTLLAREIASPQLLRKQRASNPGSVRDQVEGVISAAIRGRRQAV